MLRSRKHTPRRDPLEEFEPLDMPAQVAQTAATVRNAPSEAAAVAAASASETSAASPINEWRPTPFDEAIDTADVARLHRRLRRELIILRVISAVLIVLAICIAGFPAALQYQSQMRLSQTTSQVRDTVRGWPYPQAEDAFAAAQAYNQRLAQSGQPVLGEAVDPFQQAASGGSRAADSGDDNDDSSMSAKDQEYQQLLDTGGGVMGSIRIPEISVDLPIYHGTSESALASGAGHLYGTSLPVGGQSTHSVITGHRGLVDAMMFTRLDEMREGDFFYIEVMGETLGYRVDRISVIEPNDTSQLKIVPGEDRVTLMTCTPYGVNTHRLLVSGTRQSMPDPVPDLVDAPKDTRLSVGLAVAGALLIGLLILAVCRRTWRPMHHGARWPRHL